MTIVKTGDVLGTPKLLAGGRFQNDGYGLWTASLTFKIDKAGSSASFYRGATCPVAAFNFCKMHKASVTLGDLELDTWVADYVGIDPSTNSGFRTEVQVGINQGLTSEHITTHSNFFKATTGIAGPKPYGNSAIVPGEFKGLNGAHFESAEGGKFLGFKDTEKPLFYGKTNYLSPITSFSGHFYTKTDTEAKQLVALVGKTSGTGSFNSIQLLPSYMGTSWTSSSSPALNQILLSQVNCEDYGVLTKVNYELRYNRDGYPTQVNPAA